MPALNPQDALATFLGARTPVASSTATPLRNNARTAALSHMFGIPDDGSISQVDLESAYTDAAAAQAEAERHKAEAASIPAQVQGEYGVREAEIGASAQRDVAAANRDRAYADRDTQRDFQADQNRLNREAAFGRTQATQEGQNGRTSAVQSNITGRQQAGQAEGRARMLESGKVDPTYPKRNGMLDELQYMLGLGRFDKKTAASAEASQLRSGALTQAASGGGDDINAVVQHYKSLGLAPNVLAQKIMQDQADADPSEIAALFQALGIQ